jgi:hypothetical protein
MTFSSARVGGEQFDPKVAFPPTIGTEAKWETEARRSPGRAERAGREVAAATNCLPLATDSDSLD